VASDLQFQKGISSLQLQHSLELGSYRTALFLAHPGDWPCMETQISSDAYDRFANHLDKIGVVKKSAFTFIQEVVTRLPHGA
jgi:hypothetical protein